MKKTLLLLAILACRIISFASISYTAKLDPTLLDIITEENDSTKTSVLYYPNTVSRFVDNEPVYSIINYTFSVPYNAVGFKIESSFSGAYDFNLAAPLAVYVDNDSTSRNIDKDQILRTANAVITQYGYLSGTNQVVNVSINPFVYNGEDLSMYTQVQLTIDWQIESDEKALDMEPTYNYKAFKSGLENTKKSVINPEAVEGNAPSIAMPLTTDQQDYDYVIIAVDKLCNAAQRLAAMRRVMGYGARVFNLSYALSQFPNGDSDGFTDDAGKLKEFIKYCYQAFGTRNVLLLGKYPEMPIRKYATAASVENRNQYPTDFYFADFNSKWVPLSSGAATFKKLDADNIDFYAEVNIGRVPADTEEDVINYIEKLKIYEWNPGNGDYSYLSRGFLSRQVDGNINHFDSETLLPFYKLYEEGGLRQLISQPNLKGSEVVAALNGHTSVIHNFLGHGNPGGIATGKSADNRSYGLFALENTTGDTKYDWHMVPESKNGLDNLTNKYYPGWTQSMSCTLMPFDIFEQSKTSIYDVKKNFGESYILGKDYGGVVMLGNTREASDGQKNFLQRVYEKVWETYKDKSADPFEKLFASTMCNEIRQISFSTYTSCLSNKLMHNVFGDPLTELRFGEPMLFTITKQGNNSNIYSIGITGPLDTDYYQYATVPLIDATYASWEENDVRVEKSIELIPNEIQILTGKNAIPKILPLHIQNFMFDGSTTSYIFADQVFIEKANHYDKEDKVIFTSTADVTIESLSDVFVDDGTVFESGCKLTINAAREANLCRITVPAGSTLIVNAERIVYGEDMVTFHPNSTVILNGKRITNGSSKSGARRSEYDPMVKEGKTFWYYQRNRYNPEKVQEFGMRIGSIVNVDGEEWNEVVLIRKAEIDTTNNKILSFSVEPQTIQYVREKDMKVQTRECAGMYPDYTWNELHDKSSLCFSFRLEDNPENYIFDLYDFAPGAEHYRFGTDKLYYTMSFKSEETQNCEGVGRRVKKYAKATFEPEDREPFSAIMDGEEFDLIEGIGVKMVKAPFDEQNYMSELFFAPFSCEQYLSIPLPYGYFLRYVTDEDNNVVYEGRGGLKLWTIDPSGVEDVTTDSSEQVEWFTLSGVRVSAPGERGVYIRKCGTIAEKVIF